MGNDSSKIDDRQRSKMHKRVSYVEAKVLFANILKVTKWNLADPIFTPFLGFPVSHNFDAAFFEDGKRGMVLNLISTGGIELDGSKWSPPLYHLLSPELAFQGQQVTTEPRKIPKDYYLGLDKKQCDALYLTNKTD